MEDEHEQELLRRVALQNARSILAARQRAERELLRLKEELEDETRVLELLNTTGARLASNLELPALVQAVADAATQISGAEMGACFFASRDEGGAPLTARALSGSAAAHLDELSAGLFAPDRKGQGVVRSGAVRGGEPATPAEGSSPAIHSYLSVPVFSRSGEELGCLSLGHSQPDFFTERSERLVVGIASQASIALDNARLYQDARRDAHERAQLLAAERAARAELERVSLIKDEFLATLSHELRTPLNAVLGWAERLLARARPEDESRRGLETIARNARAQAQLIEDLLDMNRIVSGKIRLDVRQADLLHVIESALESARPSAEAKGIRLRKILDPQAAVVSGDPSRLQQVIWNLVSNAVKFTPKGGSIEVLLERINSHIEITVADSGIGISPEFLPQMFERFRQADSSTTRRYGGLGLGLSIARQLVELHGGTIRAQSAGEGLGATFVIQLPLPILRPDGQREHPGASSFPAPPQAPSGITLEGIKVLIVDDEADARALIEAVLTDSRAEVLVAASAAEALALFDSARPDVLVSDIGMPGQDGYHLIREVRRRTAPAGGKTPAIALTAFARSEDRTRAMRAGFQVHIAKPIEPQELLAAIGSLAGRLHES